MDVEAASKITYGDVDHDGDVDEDDKNLAVKAILGVITLTEEEKQICDVNGDGKFDSIDTDLIIYYVEGDISEFPVEKMLDYIKITTPPSKVEYYYGEEISYSGMVVKAYYKNGTSKTINSYSIFLDSNDIGDHVALISYTEHMVTTTKYQSFEQDVTRTAEQTIVIKDVKLTSISVTSYAKKDQYIEDDLFDSTGMVVYANYNNGSKKNVTNQVVFSPTIMKTGTTAVKLTYTENGISCYAYQSVAVYKKCYYGHTWNSGVVTKEATSTETGIKIYTCSVCNETEVEIIPINPNRVENYELEIITDGDWQYSVKDDGTIYIIKYTGQGTEIAIPSAIDNKNVSEIGDYVFSASTDIKTVSIPNSITVSEHSFDGCDKATIIYTDNETMDYVQGCCGDNAYFDYDKKSEQLRIYGTGKMYDYTRYHEDNAAPWKDWFDSIKSVSIESGITYIGTYAFAGWPFGEKDISPAIETVEMSDSVTEIGDYAFYNCKSLNDITLSNELKTIGKCTFEYDLNIKNVIFPQSLKLIDYGAFWECGFEDITLPAGTTIESFAFYYNASLEKVILGENCILSNYAFGECISLSDVKMGEGSVLNCEEGMGEGPFYKCSSLESLKLPNSWQLYDFDNDCSYVLQFLNCDALTAIILNDDNPNYKIINQVIYTIDGEKLVYYPKWLTDETYSIESTTKEILSRAFYGQNKLKHVEIPDTVKKIGYDAFNNMTIESIVIPDSVTGVECGSLYSAKKVSLSTNITQLPQGNNKLSLPNVLNDNIEEIYGKPGSYAETYATENDIPFKERIEVSFNAAGGIVSKDYKVVLPDEPYFTLPTPTRENYSFDGWYTEEQGGDKVEYSTIVTQTESHSLYAHWSVDNAVKQTAINELQNNINIEDYSEQNQELIQSIINKAVDDIANATDTDEINNIIQKVRADIDDIKTRAEEYIIVTFDAMGGTTSINQIQVIPGEAYSILPTAVRDNYIFDGWYTLGEGGEKVEPTTIVTQTTDHTLYAHWNEKKEVKEDVTVVVPETDKPQSSPKDIDNDDNKDKLEENEGLSGESDNSEKLQDNQPDSIIKDIPSLDVKDIVKQYSKKKFTLSVMTDSDGEISFSGNNKKVAEISKVGKVKLKKCGKVKITVSVKESEQYKAVTKSFTLSVVPKQVLVTRVQSPSKGAIRFKWKKISDIDGYQVYVSSTKNFKAGTAGKRFGKKEKLMFTTGFSSGKKYYLKIRTFKKVGKETYYSPWSKAKSVKVK